MIWFGFHIELGSWVYRFKNLFYKKPPGFMNKSQK